MWRAISKTSSMSQNIENELVSDVWRASGFKCTKNYKYISIIKEIIDKKHDLET